MSYTRRWKGYTAKQVSERMQAIRTKRFKSKKEAKKHAASMAKARPKFWILVNGKRKYVDKK